MTLKDRMIQNGIRYHTRAEWAGPAFGIPLNSPAAYASMKAGSIIHWNGPGMGLYGVLDVPSLIRSTWRYHVETNRWLDIAYNFAIDRFGDVWEGRGDEKWNAASGDNYANTNYLAFECMLGIGDKLPDQVKDTLVRVYRSISAENNVNYMTYHGFVTSTACPGNELIAHIANVPTLAQTPDIPRYEGFDTMDHYAYIIGTEGTYFACYAGKYFPMSYAELRMAQARNIFKIDLTEAEMAELRKSGR